LSEGESEDEFVTSKVERNKYTNEIIDHEEEDIQEEDNMAGDFLIEEEEETQFMAVKPWLGAIKSPSDF
jgi:hypothetical protein